MSWPHTEPRGGREHRAVRGSLPPGAELLLEAALHRLQLPASLRDASARSGRFC